MTVSKPSTPQQRDAYYRAIEQVVEGGTQALQPEPVGGFMGTVSTVHQDKPGRIALNKTGVKGGKLKVDLKAAPKVTTDRKKEPHRKGPLAPDYVPDYTPLDEVDQNTINKTRSSDRLKGIQAL